MGPRFRYTGQQLIGELGLYHYKARFYSPSLGRFLQTDPIGYKDDVNLYAYVGSNPANRTDPSGLIAREAVELAAGLGGAIRDGWSASVAAFQNESLGDMALKSLEGLNPTVGAAASAGVKLVGAAKGARALAEPIYKTTKEAAVAAEAMGFQKVNETVHGGQAVFKRGKDFITRDLDGHNGGAWKMADSVKNLGSKETRTGTFDLNLNRIGD